MIIMLNDNNNKKAKSKNTKKTRIYNNSLIRTYMVISDSTFELLSSSHHICTALKVIFLCWIFLHVCDVRIHHIHVYIYIYMMYTFVVAAHQSLHERAFNQLHLSFFLSPPC